VSGQTVDVDISGLCLRFEGLTHALSEELQIQWPAYVRPQGVSPALVIRVEDDERAMTPGRFMVGALQIDSTPDAVRSTRRGDRPGCPGGAGGRPLAPRGCGRRFWALLNLTCAAVGWLLSGWRRVHAAGVLLGGRAFLLVGPSGCGKTTWARTAARQPSGSQRRPRARGFHGRRLMALGSPFRAKEFPSPAPDDGLWRRYSCRNRRPLPRSLR
jgi:hypothetical protein